MRILVLSVILLFSCKTSTEQASQTKDGQEAVYKRYMNSFFSDMGVEKDFPKIQSQQNLQFKKLHNLICKMYRYFSDQTKLEAKDLDEDQIILSNCGEISAIALNSNETKALETMYLQHIRSAVQEALKRGNRSVEETEEEMAKIAEDALPFLEFASTHIQEYLQGSFSNIEREIAFNSSKREIYSTIAKGFQNRGFTIQDILSFAVKIVSGAHSVHWVGDKNDRPDFRARVETHNFEVGGGIRRESKMIVDSNSPNQFASVRNKSHLEAGRFDVHEKDPWFYTLKTLNNLRNSTTVWTNLERRITDSLNRYYYMKGIKNLKDSAPKKENYQYDIHAAKRILFFDKVSDSASSAKISTEDSWGVDWKLKWSVEAQTEPIANRLYSEIGGKFSDLTYTNSYGDTDVVLVLSGKDCNDKPVLVIEDLENCLINSKFKFLLKPYILREQSGYLATKEDALKFVKSRSPFASMSGELRLQLAVSVDLRIVPLIFG